MTEDAAEADGAGKDDVVFHAEQARPWPRFWARTLDMYLEFLVIGAAVAIVAPAIVDLPIFSEMGGDYLFGMALTPFALLLDTLILGMTGTTIGKAIAGIRAETVAHGRLSLGLAFRRNLQLYLRGLLLGLPLLILIGYVRAYRRVADRRPASWDELLDTRVFAPRSSLLRTAVTALLGVALLAGVAVISAGARQQVPDRAAEIAAVLPELNRGLPIFVDDITRFDRISYAAEEDSMIFEYQLIHRDGSSVSTGEIARLGSLRPNLVREYCGPEMKPYRDMNLPLRYRYNRPDGTVAEDYRLAPPDCG